MSDEELYTYAKELQAPYHLLKETARLKRLPVVSFAAGGVATPADAALMMRLGCDGGMLRSFIARGIVLIGESDLLLPFYFCTYSVCRIWYLPREHPFTRSLTRLRTPYRRISISPETLQSVHAPLSKQLHIITIQKFWLKCQRTLAKRWSVLRCTFVSYHPPIRFMMMKLTISMCSRAC